MRSILLFAQPAPVFHRSYSHRLGRSVEQCRDACDILFGTFSRLALQLFGRHPAGRTGRRQRNSVELPAGTGCSRLFARTAAHAAEQRCKRRTVIANRRREVSEECSPVQGLLLQAGEMAVEFRKAKSPVDLRAGKFETVFREQNPLFAIGISAILVRNTCSGRRCPVFPVASPTLSIRRIGADTF